MIEVNGKGEIWVFAEQQNGQLEYAPIELVSKAQQLWQGFQKVLGIQGLTRVRPCRKQISLKAEFYGQEGKLDEYLCR